MKKWMAICLILVAAAAFFLLALGSSSDSSETKEAEGSAQSTETKPDADTEDTDADTKAPTETETEPAAPEGDLSAIHVGDSVTASGLRLVYVASGVYESDNEFIQPKEGYQYIFMKIYAENVSDTTQHFSSMDFNCYADGYAMDTDYVTLDEDIAASLSPGRHTMGRVFFQVPVDAEQIEAEYELNYFTEKKAVFLYEGEQDSGFEAPADTEGSPDACHVGESVEAGKLTIDFLACYWDKSDNQFIQPKDGYRYVTLEFEVTNHDKSDTSVSYFSFDCYADGAACSGTYFRDDNLSATVSPGRKAKGTVTFEVPAEAQSIEVEYDASLWISHPVIFACEPED